EATVCHPAVDVSFYSPGSAPRQRFLLAVGAFVAYKKFEDAIAAAESSGRQLKIVGRGPEEKRLRALAGPSVIFLSDQTPEQLRDLYRSCAALVQPGEEDFGIAAVEALACGAPVVALARGGVLDIVDSGKHGVLYEEAGPGGLAAALAQADSIRFDYNDLRTSALRFFPGRLRENFSKALTSMIRSPARSILYDPLPAHRAFPPGLGSGRDARRARRRLRTEVSGRDRAGHEGSSGRGALFPALPLHCRSLAGRLLLLRSLPDPP